MSQNIAVHPAGPTPGIKPVLPSTIPRTEQCEVTLQIGVFFDGTGNNQEWNEADSCLVGWAAAPSANVARTAMWRGFIAHGGCYRMYVHGIGTSCHWIGEMPAARGGIGFSLGG